MALLLDHCVKGKFFRLLKNWGYEVTRIQDHVKPDADDIAVLDLAQQLDAVLVTEDMDFSNILDYPPQNYAGIVVIRYQAKTEADAIEELKLALEDMYRDRLRGKLMVVTHLNYRIRPGSPTE